MKSRLFADLLPPLGLLVSVFGLLSCTQHTSSTPDSWALPAPLLHETESGNSRPLMTSLTEPIAADADLVFPGTRAGFADVIIDVNSNCTSSLGSQSSVLHLKGVNVIPVREFLPASLWRRLDLPSGAGATCSVRFSAKNKNGSTHNFEIAGVQFAHFERLENLGIQDTRTNKSLFAQEMDASLREEKSAATLSAKGAAHYEFTQASSSNEAASFDLICDHFHNHREIGSEQPHSAVIRELMLGTPERESIGAQALENDGRPIFTNQRCRIVTMSADTKTGLKNILMTPAFRLQFPLAADKIKETALSLQLDDGNILQGKVAYSIAIENPTTITQAFRVPKLIGDDLQLQNLYWKTNRVFAGRPIPIERLETKIIGTDRVWQDDGSLVFEITPGKKVEIQVILAKTPVRCIQGAANYIRTEMYKTEDFGFSVGFKMKWKREFLVRRYLNWDPANVLLSGLTAKVQLSKEFEESNEEEGGRFASPLLFEIFQTKKITDLDMASETTYTLCFRGNIMAANADTTY